MNNSFKSVFVEAPMKKLMEHVTKQVPTGELKKGFFGGDKRLFKEDRVLQVTGISNCEVDGDELATQVNLVLAELVRNGYEPITVIPITSGAYNYKDVEGQRSMYENREAIVGGGWGYGYSYTEGVLLVAKIVRDAR